MKQYKAGDKVKIRSWESMEKEFGSCDEDGDILIVPYFFAASMRELCGKELTVEKVNGGHITLEGTTRFFSSKMFDPEYKPPLTTIEFYQKFVLPCKQCGGVHDFIQLEGRAAYRIKSRVVCGSYTGAFIKPYEAVTTWNGAQK